MVIRFLIWLGGRTGKMPVPQGLAAVDADAEGGFFVGEVVVVIGVDAEGDLHGIGWRGIEGERQADVTSFVRRERDGDAGFGVDEVARGRRR